MPQFKFQFEGRWYECDRAAFRIGCAVLPDGRMVKAGIWLVTGDDQPDTPHEIEIVPGPCAVAQLASPPGEPAKIVQSRGDMAPGPNEYVVEMPSGPDHLAADPVMYSGSDPELVAMAAANLFHRGNSVDQPVAGYRVITTDADGDEIEWHVVANTTYHANRVYLNSTEQGQHASDH